MKNTKKIPLFTDIISTGIYFGYFPIMPGTIGSLIAIPIGYIGSLVDPVERIILGIVIFFLGVFVSSKYSDITGVKDPSCVVIDEIAALSIIYFIFPFNLAYVIAGFIFFRFFDILKPYPIKKLENLPKGWGIMVDDIMAGIYAGICCEIVGYLVDRFIARIF